MKQKYTCDMDFNEFVQWATEHVVERFLEEGLKGIRTGIYMVVNQAAMNKEFGGGKTKTPTVKISK